MTLKSSTIRWAIIISSVLIALIVFTQVLWLKRVYQLEQREFNGKVLNVVKGVYDDVDEPLYTKASHLSELVRNPLSFVYVAKITLPVDSARLINAVKKNLTTYNVFTLCEAAVYDLSASSNLLEAIIPSANSTYKTGYPFPETEHDFNHLTLYFPNRNKYVLQQMNFWVISSLLLLIVLILFSIGLYHLFRQRFLNELQKDFIHNFTHEFKTPVAVLTLASEVLGKPTIVEQPRKLTTYAGIVAHQSHHLRNQIERLLRLAFTDSTGIQLDREEVDIHSLIEEAVTNLDPLIQEKKAVIRYDLQATEVSIKADRNYLIIVLVNLIDNALKYARDPEVRIATRRTSNQLAISVSDNGMGIEKKYLKKIFRKFYRIKKEDIYNSKGFGIGLSFVKQIMEQHGGTIRAESEPGQGSTFTIYLPYNR